MKTSVKLSFDIHENGATIRARFQETSGTRRDVSLKLGRYDATHIGRMETLKFTSEAFITARENGETHFSTYRGDSKREDDQKGTLTVDVGRHSAEITATYPDGRALIFLLNWFDCYHMGRGMPLTYEADAYQLPASGEGALPVGSHCFWQRP